MRTLGIEEELLLVDARTGEPATSSSRIIRNAPQQLQQHDTGDTVDRRDGPGGTVGAELQQQQLEVDTPPRAVLEELRQDLEAWRSAAAAAAADVGARIVASGTSPLSAEARLTPDERYRRIVEHLGISAEDQLVCACHVHVSIESEAEGVGVLDRIRPWLPALLALSANSPYWKGRDSGYASFRSQAWYRWPATGPTDVFGSITGYRRLVDDMVSSGVVLDRGMVYFDARLSAEYPTVEIRVTDICLDPADAVLVAGLCRGLVETAARSWSAGEPPADVSTAMLRLAMWQAGKAGADGELLDPRSGRPRPAPEVFELLVDHVRPALEEYGDLATVRDGIAQVLERGNGARRQRAVMSRSGDLAEVVADLADATAGAT